MGRQDDRRRQHRLLFVNYTGLDVKLRKSNGGGLKRQTAEMDSEDQAVSEAIQILNERHELLVPRRVKKVVDQRAFDSAKDS